MAPRSQRTHLGDKAGGLGFAIFEWSSTAVIQWARLLRLSKYGDLEKADIVSALIFVTQPGQEYG